MNKRTIALITLFVSIACGPVSAQISFKLPEISIKGKGPKKNDTTKTIKEDGRATQDQTRHADGKLVFPFQRPNSTPVLLKNTLHIEAITNREYWKMPNQSNYSSWVPKLRFDHFYNNDKAISYTVQYFNPDGSAWYSEKLEQSNTQDAEQKVLFQSPSPWDGVMDTKSTAAVGMFGFKITNDNTGEVLYQGKFKVGKYTMSHDPAREKNKVGFYVDHDWLLPFGQIGFHHSGFEIGGMPVLASFWLKGAVESNELEARVFYKGQQIATTAGDGGAVGSVEERYSDAAPAWAAQNVWKRWQAQWHNFQVDNNGSFNRELFPNAFYADKNPGDYTVKLYRNGTQVRELTFTVGADGRFVQPAYAGQVFIPYYRTLLPAKVSGTEKWGVNDWKTDAFYGNPLPGFTVQ